MLPPPHVRIFYFCYSHDRPTGGQKQAYHHVDILNRHPPSSLFPVGDAPSLVARVEQIAAAYPDRLSEFEAAATVGL